MKSDLDRSSRICGAPPEGLAGGVVRFSRFLRSHGFKIFPTSVVESLRSLEECGLCARGDFFNVLRANLATDETEWNLFAELFKGFWMDIGAEEGEEGREGEERGVEEPSKPSEPGEDPHAELPVEAEPEQKGDVDVTRRQGSLGGAIYSPVVVLEKKNLAQFERGELRNAELLLKNILSSFRVSVSRRFRRSKRPGEIDFHRILRKGLRGEEIPLALLYRRKKKRLKRLVVLADVSGSMDRYARFVIPFVIGLKSVGPRAELFVFSTSLTRITSVLRRVSVEKALEVISSKVPDWSGGTRIGHSLQQFNIHYGKRHLNRRTVILIMSDGWDLGAGKLLNGAMQILSNKVSSVIWLNPLAGDPGYKPICSGMQAALPYIDHFLPADSLESLKRVRKTLARAMAGK